MLPNASIKAEPLIEDMVFQQHMLQMKQQQIMQQQLLEEHYQKNRALLHSQHEKQISAFLQQLEQQRQREEAEKQRDSRVRLDVLRQKDETNQSAVASPEVKRRLQEVILQRKRKEAASSMGNLQACIPVSSVPPAPTALLRKVQSESNLLKIKTRRGLGERGGVAPYSRGREQHLQWWHPMPWPHPNLSKLVPEASVVSGSEDSTPSPISGHSNLSAPLGSPAPANPPQREHSQSPGSSPGSPRSSNPAPRPSPLANTLLNSRSLPNIPSSLDLSRRSPPAPPPHRPSHGPHRRNLLEKSHSVAILPLRRHLMQRSMAERKSMDDNQYYWDQKNKLERERGSRGKLILPLEEVMEEEPSSRKNLDEMETEQVGPSTKSFTPFVGVGPSGISPLVLSDPRLSVRTAVHQIPANRTLSPELRAAPAHRTGLAFHAAMLKHQCVCESSEQHPESPERLQFLLSRLRDAGLLQDCLQVSMMGSLEQVESCHTEGHTLMFGTQRSILGQSLARDPGTLSKLTVLPCGGLGVDSDTYWNELHTSSAAKSAVGSLVELTDKIVSGQLSNGFALVRPPGHHAEAEEAMGFCFFNNVAIAAKQLLKRPDMRRIMIVDWAIHHGNGTQKVFYEDPRVLYISLHRHDNGNFYPGTGGSTECGANVGLGTNINIAWSGGLEPPMGDAEYLAAFRTIVLPVARDFAPDMVLVSAGFDAGVGHEHPIGGYKVSPACWAFLTRQLMGLANGRLALVLEGGYNLDTLCNSVEQCTRALMGLTIEKIPHEELARRPCQNAVETLQKTIAIQGQYWGCLAAQLDAARLSHFECWGRERVGEERLREVREREEGREEEGLSSLSGMASLSVHHQQAR